MEILQENKEIGHVQTPTEPKNTKRLIQKDLKKNWFVYLMALPVVAWFLIFCYGPMWGVMIAFKDFKPLLGFADSDWVGFKHFIDFSQDPIFGESSRIRSC